MREEKNIAGFMRGGKFFPIRSGTVWPKGEPGKRRPQPHQASLPYNEFKAGDFDRRRAMQYEDMTLTQFVRSQGGIKPDRDRRNEGEWRRLTAKESGVRGLAFEGARKTAESMADSAREVGFNVPRNPNAFLDVLEADAAGMKVIHHPEWYEREAERQFMAHHSNAFFTDEDTRRARRVKTLSDDEIKRLTRQASVTHFQGKRVRRGRREATVRKAYLATDGTVLLDIGTAARAELVTPTDVEFINPLLSKATITNLVAKVRAGQKLKAAYRREVGLRNEITRAQREEDDANKKAQKAEGRFEQRKWEAAAARAYKRRVKAEARLAKAQAARQTAAQVAMSAYANTPAANNPAPRASAADVTPDIARAMLRANIGNRPVDHRDVAARAARMKQGTFKRRAPIVFTNDLLTDGQHTLLAIVKSGVTIPLRVEHRTLSPRASAQGAKPRAQGKRTRDEKNPLGEVGLQTVGGAAAGAAGALAGALLAPLIERYVKNRREKKAALEAVKPNPARPDAKTAATLASIGRARLILAAREKSAAGRPSTPATKARQHQQRARNLEAEGLELLRRAAAAYPVQGNPIALTPRAVEKLHREFRGFPTSGQVTPYHTPLGSPHDAPYLGQLHKIILADGRELTFNNNPAALLGTVRGRRRLLIGLTNPYATPAGADPRALLDYGEIVEVQYITPKPHLYDGDFTEKLFFHELGEEGGKCPHLVLQNGRLSFRGGGYTVKREGIRN
jgi:hypothetical protein